MERLYNVESTWNSEICKVNMVDPDAHRDDSPSNGAKVDHSKPFWCCFSFSVFDKLELRLDLKPAS